MCLFLGSSLQQLQIQVTKLGYSDEAKIVASYARPTGLSLDWWKTSYINIPQTGLEGVLLYQPDLCFTHTPRVPEGCLESNFSLILLTPQLLSCPERVVQYAQENGYSGIITYNTDNNLAIENIVYDPLSKSFVDLQSTGLLVAEVSAAFAGTLHRTAVYNCKDKSYPLTAVSRGGANVTGVRFGISVFMGVTMIFGLFLIVACTSLALKCIKRRSSGFYDVQSVQTQELEFSTPSEAQEHSVQSLYMPEIKTFDGSGEDGTSSTCTICLDCFSHGEDVCVLDCKGGHTFHPPCIRKWLMSQSTCPVCRNHLQANL